MRQVPEKPLARRLSDGLPIVGCDLGKASLKLTLAETTCHGLELKRSWVIDHQLNWREGTCDGIVVASPWSCAPGLVAESLLRHERQIPMLFVYCDGAPLDEPRLGRFAFRLKRAAEQRAIGARERPGHAG